MMIELKIGQPPQSMDWMEWSSIVISSVAWPLVIIIIFFLLRGVLVTLLTKVTKLTWGDKAVDFSGGLEILEEVRKEEYDYINDEVDNSSDKLLQISPRASVLEAWFNVEKMVDELYFNLKEKPTLTSKTLSFNNKIDILRSFGKINSLDYEYLDELRRLRNLAAHSDASAISNEEAKKFRSLSEFMLGKLEVQLSRREG